MKKLLLICIVAPLFMCGCTKQQKAEKAVKQHLKIVLNDPNSYDPGLFTPIDSLFAESDDLFIGYALAHSYRAKNKMGGVVSESGLFYVSKDLKTAYADKEDLIRHLR